LSPSTDVIPNFPTLVGHPDYIFADNAGGSAVLSDCISTVSSYLINTNVQLGGGYAFSVKAGEQVQRAVDATAKLVNVDGGAEQVVFGSSTTQLATNLGYACQLEGLRTGGLFEEGDEIIVTAADHEGEP
jgi:selenocysteine lyase/cysteine desulfurase